MGATDHNFFYSLMSPSKLFLKSWMSAFNGEGGYKSGEYTILESLPAYGDHHSDLLFYAPFLKMVWW
jgi:hypothetical protein